METLIGIFICFPVVFIMVLLFAYGSELLIDAAKPRVSPWLCYVNRLPD